MNDRLPQNVVCIFFGGNFHLMAAQIFLGKNPPAAYLTILEQTIGGIFISGLFFFFSGLSLFIKPFKDKKPSPNKCRK